MDVVYKFLIWFASTAIIFSFIYYLFPNKIILMIIVALAVSLAAISGKEKE